MKGVIIMKKLALALIIIGAINWGIIGLFNYDLISNLFGANLTMISRIIFVVVGIAGLYAITFLWDRRDTRRVSMQS